MSVRARLYDLVLVALVAGAVVVALVTDDAGTWEPRAELTVVGVSGSAPEWGRLEAPELSFTPIGRVVTLGRGVRLSRRDVDLNAGAAELRLTGGTARFDEVTGRIDATQVELGAALVQPGDLVARDIELTGSLRARTLDAVRVREVSASRESLARWRQRAEEGWGAGTRRVGAMPVSRLRVRDLVEHARSVVLRNVDLFLAGGDRVRALRVTIPKTGGACTLEDVEVVVNGERREFDEMSLDLETLELAPRRSLVARTLGQQWNAGVYLDELEVAP